MSFGNHRPRLASAGEAIRRRLHLVPFAVTIPPERRDRQLVEKLQAERDGILGWALAGHADWRRNGLAPPASVAPAVSAYLEDEDIVGQWIRQDCKVAPDSHATASALFASWSAFAETHGFDKGSSRSLGEALTARGFRSGRSNKARYWAGIAPRKGVSRP